MCQASPCCEWCSKRRLHGAGEGARPKMPRLFVRIRTNVKLLPRVMWSQPHIGKVTIINIVVRVSAPLKYFTPLMNTPNHVASAGTDKFTCLIMVLITYESFRSFLYIDVHHLCSGATVLSSSCTPPDANSSPLLGSASDRFSYTSGT